MIDPYRELLLHFAARHALDAGLLLETEEVVLEGVPVGMCCEREDGMEYLLYFADLGLPEPSRSAEVHRTLLEANHFWLGTAGATLGVQQATGHVVLSGRAELTKLNPEALSRTLELFAGVARFWQHFITHGSQADEAAPPLPWRA